MEKKKLIIVAVALIAVVIVIAGAAIALLQPADTYASRIEMGYRYLESNDYDNAILMFTMAMEMDETLEDAYYGLYRAYTAKGDHVYAKTALNMGYKATSSQNMFALLNDSKAPEVPQQTQPSQSEDKNEKEENKTAVPVLNQQLLIFMSSANYGEYCVRYGAGQASVVSGKHHMRCNGLAATLVYYDTSSAVVIDAAKGEPYNVHRPNEIQLDDVRTLFGGMDLSFDVMKNLGGVTNPIRNGNTVTFEFNKTVITIICDNDGMITEESENHIVPSGEVASTEVYNLSTSIIDATTGQPVSDAKVKAYAGRGTSGECVEGTTDGTGAISLELKQSGTHTLVIEKEGYIVETFEVYVLSGSSTTYETLSISPSMEENAIRFVLTWDAAPQDLDSYLVGNGSDGTYTKVSFRDMSVSGSNGTIAELDVDDTNGFGPETITLYDTAGSYEFVVVDFTGSGTMSYSNAQVKIYIGNSLHTVVSVPQGLENGWHVCTVENGQITVTNTTAATSGGDYK